MRLSLFVKYDRNTELKNIAQNSKAVANKGRIKRKGDIFELYTDKDKHRNN